ncbi:MAG: hypothetical protein AAF590_00895 [Pseudomonadota bacterium]
MSVFQEDPTKPNIQRHWLKMHSITQRDDARPVGRLKVLTLRRMKRAVARFWLPSIAIAASFMLGTTLGVFTPLSP